MNNRWHTAVHEAGHAVIGRVLGMTCGHVTIAADHDSAGHSITADPWYIMDAWERRGRFREIGTVFRGRAMTLMAGAEAEALLAGECQGGDGDDRHWIACMLDSEAAKPGVDPEQLEDRLRRATQMLVRRHVGKIHRLALALWHHDTIGDEADIRAAAGMEPEPPAFDYWASIGMSDTIDDLLVSRIVAPPSATTIFNSSAVSDGQ